MKEKIMIDMDDVITCDNFEKSTKRFLGYEFDFSKFKGYRMQDALGTRKREYE